MEGLKALLQVFMLHHNELAGEATWTPELEEHIDSFLASLQGDRRETVHSLMAAIDRSEIQFIEQNYGVHAEDAAEDVAKDKAVYSAARGNITTALLYFDTLQDNMQECDRYKLEFETLRGICKRASTRASERQSKVFELRERLASALSSLTTAVSHLEKGTPADAELAAKLKETVGGL